MGSQNMRPPTIAVTPEEYQKMSAKATPGPTVVKNAIWAFFIGGLICSLGQILINVLQMAGLPKTEASSAATAIMIFLGALLTGLGIYDNIVKYAGAGAIVPVTGFANSIVAPALEFKREGYVTGVGARLFTVAGPVLVYGIAVSIAAGILYYIFHL
jgi:stage V sporulation protein AC